MNDRIHLSKAHVSDVEERYVLGALRSGWVAPLGPDVDAFETEMAEFLGVRYALALSSGTAALHLALLNLGARPGTTVVVPTLTFAASANAVVYTGAEPVFVDSRNCDGNIDPFLLVDVVDRLRSRGQTVSAVMTVDLFGQPCDYQHIEPALAERGVPLLEDAAEALGSRYGGRATGSFGHAAALSFNGNKIMTTSGGGMLLSNDSDMVAHARKLSTQAREDTPWYEHKVIGYNYRLSNILAALGRAQLTRLGDILTRRQEVYNHYRARLSHLSIRFLSQSSAHQDTDTQSNRWLVAAVFKEDVNIDQLIASLDQDGIEARHIWKPLHLQPSMKGFQYFGGTEAFDLFRHGLVLPSGHGLTALDIDYVCDRLIHHLGGSQ